ncbi:ABC transporter ATP-binding protein [Methanorbis rubei]|uniref:Cobalamin import ATP-binding protein BtuD n=1 Tax=Methanorbis rubei TaxID=3028300 RepID=A0AAE4SB61_9EURY|nr:Vitamin B12 import ATP-binding protein BtuD [Methanocorpusculaceae archaeon Cs1]
MTPILRVKEIVAGYEDFTVIHNLSMTVEAGSFVGILGKNGCGKSTLLKTLSRILSPNQGTVYLNEHKLEEYDSRTFAKNLGCVRQETDVVFPFTVREIVLMGRHPYAGRLNPLSAEDLKIADEMMQITNTTHLAGRLITEVSGGERQRVLIARTLAQQPKILLLDEPTSHLDIQHQIEILSLIQNLTPKITVVGVFHDLNLAAQFCDRLILMGKGTILADGTPAEVLTTEMIGACFQVDMIACIHPNTGKPHLIPAYTGKEEQVSLRVHVISGGGTGTDLLHTLYSRGCQITAGVLAANDTDALTTRVLGIETVRETPFEKISDNSIDQVSQIIKDTDVIVVTGMPIGYGNLANLEILKETTKPVYFIGEIQDYTKGAAEEIKKDLIRKGAFTVSNIPELLSRILP